MLNSCFDREVDRPCVVGVARFCASAPPRQTQREVVQFLTRAGLRKYAEPLIVNGFEDMPTLLEIDDDDMKDSSSSCL